jgi:2-oxoglutarate/2-oxoacid ferredoxin oxidoreductase subunit beta
MILPTKNSWCPGCGNFGIQNALKEAVSKIDKRKTVVVTGIGCHGKMADYLDVNTFYSLHGRAIPSAVGVKIGNEDLEVICCVGDGDAYNEGIAHLIHAAKRNSNITVIVHDNHAFSLTVKQATSTSPRGFKGSTTPKGSIEDPINPLEMMLSVGATFVARGYVGKPDHLERLISEGIKHKGFSFIEVLQPCIAWYNTYSTYNERVYELEEELSFDEALKKAKEWDYNSEERIALGIFHKKEKKTLEEQMGEVFKVNIEELLEKSK